MNTDTSLTLLSKCCFLHEEALLIQKPASYIDEEIIDMLKMRNDPLFSMIPLLVKCFQGEKRKDGSSRTLHAYDVARIALEGLNFLHPSILKLWGEKETETVVFSALAHDLLEDGNGIGKTDITRLFSQEISDIVFELTIPKQKNYEDGRQLCIQKFNLFSIESACLYPKTHLPNGHFHLPPSAIGAYVKLCDTVSSLRANVLRGIPGWNQENYHKLMMNFKEATQNLSPLNPFVWKQFELTSQQLTAKWDR
jgi:hypothetical protein